MPTPVKLDPETLETLKKLHAELELEDAPEEPEEQVPWEELLGPADPVAQWLDRIVSIGNKVYKRFTKSKEAQVIAPVSEASEPRLGTNVSNGDVLTRELEDAWNMYTRGVDEIPCRSVGYVLRILGQNPTEDEIVEMVMKANCDWEGLMSKKDFLGVSVDILRASCDQMDDVKAAFRVFDHNNDGCISKEELREAMVNFGTRFTDEEFILMFAEADKNNDGLIDFDEFVCMMLPSTPYSTGGATANLM